MGLGGLWVGVYGWGNVWVYGWGLKQCRLEDLRDNHRLTRRPPTYETTPYLHGGVCEDGDSDVGDVASEEPSHGRHGRLEHAHGLTSVHSPQTHVRVAGRHHHRVVGDEGGLGEGGQSVNEHSGRHLADVVGHLLRGPRRVDQVHPWDDGEERGIIIGAGACGVIFAFHDLQNYLLVKRDHFFIPS